MTRFICHAAFSAGRFEEAARRFSEAIDLARSNHVLYSNCSAAYASLHRYAEALADAQKIVELKPDWAKGYSRLGAAHVGLGTFDDAAASYKKGLEIEPDNEALKSGLADAQATAARSHRGPPPSSSPPFGNIFQGPELWAKLTADPTTKNYLQQPDFVKMMQEVQMDPKSINLYLSDKRMMQALGVLLNVKMRTPEDMEKEALETEAPRKAPEPEKPKGSPEHEPESEPMDVTEEEKEVKQRKAEAQKEEEAGNSAYKKKDFETAIQHYTKALELDDADISFLTNRAAVYMEMGKAPSTPSSCSSLYLLTLVEEKKGSSFSVAEIMLPEGGVLR